jgi:hypothetical protein
MAFGQIDPARLEGDALRRWYLRSPEDVERERRRRAEQNYSAFYGGLQNLRQPASPTPNRLRSANDFASTDRGGTSQVAAYDVGAPQSTTSGARKPKATVDDCVDCHGRLPSPPQIPGMLPPFGKLPLPGGFPFFRDLPGGAPPPPRRGERKQCEMQERSDRGICSQQPTEPAKAVCNESAFRRRVHCDRTGEIGEPGLSTARRESGRRWP